jgi:hypothetical protein
LAFFVKITASFFQNADHNIGFLEKRLCFCPKYAKIAENCDHNIGPRLPDWTNFRPLADYLLWAVLRKL